MKSLLQIGKPERAALSDDIDPRSFQKKIL
jgi:hypothetical protein